MKNEPPVIELKKVCKKYSDDTIALYDISFSLKRGEFCFLTGPSGSGKTTILRLLYFAEMPTSGDIMLDGLSVSAIKPSHLPVIRRRIGTIFQDFKLLNDRTVFDNIALALEVAGYGKEQIRSKIEQAIDGLGLRDKLNKYPRQLSGGEQQRVAIARAIVNRPSIILADEPTGNLDADFTMEVMDILDYLNSRGATILFATHDERLYEGLKRRVITIEKGRIKNIEE